VRPVIRRILSRPVGVLVASVAVVVVGALSFANIPLQLLPEGFESRHLSVRARLRDSSPQEAERHVAIPIEEALGTVAGIESVSSRCERDRVRVSIELKSDADPASVERDVRDELPSDCGGRQAPQVDAGSRNGISYRRSNPPSVRALNA